MLRYEVGDGWFGGGHHAWNGVAARGLAGRQGAAGRRGLRSAGARGGRALGAVRCGHGQRCRTRRSAGAAGRANAAACRRYGPRALDRVRRRAASTRPETAPSASGAGADDSGDGSLHRVSVGVGAGGVAVAGAGYDDVAARSAHRRGDVAVVAGASARLGAHERRLRSHRAAAGPSSGGGSVVHEGGGDDSAERVAATG